MKKFITLSLLLFCSLTVFSQQKGKPLFFSENPNAILYSLPRTSLKVSVVVEKETIRKGPYARFAQRYLGVMAPLADKNLYKIKGASIVGLSESDPTQVYSVDASSKTLQSLIKQQGSLPMPISDIILEERFGAQSSSKVFNSVDEGLQNIDTKVQAISQISSDSSFVKLSPDRLSSSEQNPEQMAFMAAETIYKLRKRRFELITGESGENVFGSGLQVAIDELNRLEEEYIALFLGKQSVQQIVKEYEIIPEADKNTYIICRFSTTDGLVSATDLSGQPIIMEVKMEQSNPLTQMPRKPGKEIAILKYRIAEPATCRLLDGSTEIVKERIPIYQFGAIQEIPIN